MPTEVRFAAFSREAAVQQRELSYDILTPKPATDGAGNDLPYVAPKMRLEGREVLGIVRPYLDVRFREQLRAVLPLALYLMMFQYLILRQPIQETGVILAGLMAVIVGLMLFMEGLKVGLMPFGEIIGSTLPAKAALAVVLLIAFMLGIGVTFAEPAIGALKIAGGLVNVRDAPYLYALLNDWSGVMVLCVGVGVGAAAVLGTMRFLYGWSLKLLIYATLIPTLALTAYVYADPALRPILGLAWDCGAVTTGPVTVPLVLSLGIGIAGAAGKGQNSLSGFGIVTLASLFPIIGVLLLSVVVSLSTTPTEIIAASVAQETLHAEAVPAWHMQTPWVEIIGGVRAIVPLILFLFLVLIVVLRSRLPRPGAVTYGIVLSVIGMIVFNLGLTYGLSKLGGQSGGLVPAAFTDIDGVEGDPLFGPRAGLWVSLGFAWVLGFGATLAEPALNALGTTVQTLTNGAFRKSMLMYAVSIGVGFGIALGVVKIIFGFSIALLLGPLYLVALAITALSTEEFVNIAWDSAGVTTGPITVPLVLAMGLGFGGAMEAVEGFGILAMASICPILSVLLTGLWVRWKLSRKRRRIDEAVAAAKEATA